MTIVLSEADYARISLPIAGVIKEAIKGIKIARGEAYDKVTVTIHLD